MTTASRVRLGAGILAAALLVAAHEPTPRGSLDRAVFDLVAPHPTGPSPVEGVAITPEDIEQLPAFGVRRGHWPWKRLAHGAVVHALQSLGASGVAFTLFFERPDEASSDAGFVREIETAGRPVALATFLTSEAGDATRPPEPDLGLEAARAHGLDPPDLGPARALLPSLQEAATAVGAVNLPEGGLTATRGVPVVYRSGDRLIPSLALALVAGEDLTRARWEAGPTLVCGSHRIPLTPRGHALVRLEPVPRRRVRELLESFAARERQDPAVTGKSFVVGLEGTGLGAVHEVPGGPPLPSYQVQAALARSLLAEAWLRPLGAGAGLLLLGLLLLLAAAAATRGASLVGALAALGLGALAPLALAAAGLWIGPGNLLAATLIGAGGPALWARAEAGFRQRQREEEMRRAEHVARSLLPTHLPSGVRGMLVPARVAAGDYHDALEIPGGDRLALVADVSGKGLDGAMLAGQVRAAFRAFAADTPDPAALLARLNAFLTDDLQRSGRLVTALCARLGPGGALAVAAAAHPPLLVLGPEGHLREVPARGRPLGYSPDTTYAPQEDRLETGEWGILLSDGVLDEPRSAGGPRPGLAGIRARLEGLAEPSASRIAEALLVSDGAPGDDQTLVLLEPVQT